MISADDSSGTLEFSVAGDDAGTFFPVKASFIAEGSLIGLSVASVTRVDNGEAAAFSQDISVSADDYHVL